MIRTSICDLLGIELPIIHAPIASATCSELAVAVSNSGGLGMLSLTWRQPDEIREKAGRPPRGERPNEGQVIARKADGTPVVRYSFSSPLETMQGDVEGMVHYAGQSVGLIKDIQPAARIVQQLKQETEQVMGQWQ